MCTHEKFPIKKDRSKDFEVSFSTYYLVLEVENGLKAIKKPIFIAICKAIGFTIFGNVFLIVWEF